MKKRIGTLIMKPGTPHFSLRHTHFINLEENRIRNVPTPVFSTFNTSLPLRLFVRSDDDADQFCYRHAACNCSDFCEFGHWLKKHNGSFHSFEAQCANKMYDESNLWELPLNDACMTLTTSLTDTPDSSISTPVSTKTADLPATVASTYRCLMYGT